MSELWSKVKVADLQITWHDAELPSSRHYGDGGLYVLDDNIATIQPSTWGLKFLPVFALVFWVVSTVVTFVCAAPPFSWLIAFAIPFCGGPALYITYWLIKKNVEAGPYISADPGQQIVLLPRYGRQFATTEIVCLQWISGRSQRSNDHHTELYLITKIGDANLRTFVMGSPDRYHVRKLSKHANIPIVEVDTGFTGYRDISLDTDG